MGLNDFMVNDLGPFLRRRGVWVLLIFVALCTAALLLSRTRWGIDIFNDDSGNGQKPYEPR